MLYLILLCLTLPRENSSFLLIYYIVFPPLRDQTDCMWGSESSTSFSQCAACFLVGWSIVILVFLYIFINYMLKHQNYYLFNKCFFFFLQDYIVAKPLALLIKPDEATV